jgi:hypothetical protein
VRARRENKETEEGRKVGEKVDQFLGLRQIGQKIVGEREEREAHQLTTSERMSTHPPFSPSKAKPSLQDSGLH